MQALNLEPESIYVEELGKELSKEEIFNVLVVDPMMGAIEVDWRDFFPYLRWVPNRTFEIKLKRMLMRRAAVMQVLITKRKNSKQSKEVLLIYFFFAQNLFVTIIFKNQMSQNLNIQTVGDKLLFGLSAVSEHFD